MRTKQTQNTYDEYLKTFPKDYCPFCNKELLIYEYKKWYLLKNRFPYDNKATKHHLLVPKRHIAEHCMITTHELGELHQIREELKDKYNCIMENFIKSRSITNHFHYHLIVWKI